MTSTAIRRMETILGHFQQPMDSPFREKIVIIGSGWGGLTLSRKLDDRGHVTIISPQRTCPYTPLLASTACGLFHSSLAEEPIRKRSKAAQRYIQATVTGIDFKRKIVLCAPAFSDLADQTFEVKYDVLVLSPGCTNQTFGIPGVAEYGMFVRNVADAIAVKRRVHDILEKASLPSQSEQQQRDLLHIIVVGGGPTGVEITAELYDLFREDIEHMYPDLRGKYSISIHDVASNILSAFEANLSKYALDSFTRRAVEIKTNSHITRVEKDRIHTKEDGEIPYGLLVWATGNKAIPLVSDLPVKKSSGLPRIQTDPYLRVFDPKSQPMESVYAIGDAADIEGNELPTTAEVVCQKAEYLAKLLNAGKSSSVAPFQYKQKAIVAYLGQHDGVIGGKSDWEGASAWIAWRSKNLTWTRSWRTKFAIMFTWLLNIGFGKDLAVR